MSLVVEIWYQYATYGDTHGPSSQEVFREITRRYSTRLTGSAQENYAATRDGRVLVADFVSTSLETLEYTAVRTRWAHMAVRKLGPDMVYPGSEKYVLTSAFVDPEEAWEYFPLPEESPRQVADAIEKILADPPNLTGTQRTQCSTARLLVAHQEVRSAQGSLRQRKNNLAVAGWTEEQITELVCPEWDEL